MQIDGISKSLRADLQCEAGTVVDLGSSCNSRICQGFNINITMDITAPGCNITGFNYTRSCSQSLSPSSCEFKDAWITSCDNGYKSHSANRLVFMLGELFQDLSQTSDPVDLLTNKTTTILCEPDYRIVDAQVRMDQAGNILNERDIIDLNKAAPAFPAWDLVEGLHTSTQAATSVFGLPYSYRLVTEGWRYYEIREFFYNWIQTQYPSGNVKDPEFLKEKVSEVFSIAAAQMANSHLLKASDETQIGRCDFTEDRLRIRGLSLYLMVACLLILLVSVLFFIYIRPKQISSRDPTTIAGLALVISQSPGMMSVFSDKGAASLEIMRRDLAQKHCRSTFPTNQGQRTFSLELVNNGSKSGESSSPERPKPGPDPVELWNPLSLRRSFGCLTVVSLLILVVVLEVMYWYSLKHDGIAEVDTRSYIRFVWAYVPAIVMLSAHTLVAMAAFSSLQIFPYFLLGKRSNNNWDDVSRDYLSKFSIQSLAKAISEHHWPVTCMSLAALLGPLLTVVVSGLYTPHEIQSHLKVDLLTTDVFNASYKHIDLKTPKAFAPASTNIGLLLTQNFTSPLWTYEEFALPQFDIDYPENFEIDADEKAKSNITVVIPGIRANLDCKIIKTHPKNFSTLIEHAYDLDSKISVKGYDDHGCQPSVWTMPHQNPFGFFSQSSLGPKSAFCGAFGISEIEWIPFTCENEVKQLDVEITLAAATSTILYATPLESSIKHFSNETVYGGNSNYFPSQVVPSLFGSGKFDGHPASYYDPVFQAVIRTAGTTGDPIDFPMKLYMDDEGFEKITLHLQHVYRLIIAQTAATIRIPLNATLPATPPQRLNGTLHYPGVWRLRQSGISTRLLDGLLITIAICVAISFTLMDATGVLPKNPSSIAAGASFISGRSDWLQDDLVQSAQWCDDSELRRNPSWSGLKFRLMWWNTECKEGREIQNFGLDARKEHHS